MWAAQCWQEDLEIILLSRKKQGLPYLPKVENASQVAMPVEDWVL